MIYSTNDIANRLIELTESDNIFWLYDQDLNGIHITSFYKTRYKDLDIKYFIEYHEISVNGIQYILGQDDDRLNSAINDSLHDEETKIINRLFQ